MGVHDGEVLHFGSPGVGVDHHPRTGLAPLGTELPGLGVVGTDEVARQHGHHAMGRDLFRPRGDVVGFALGLGVEGQVGPDLLHFPCDAAEEGIDRFAVVGVLHQFPRGGVAAVVAFAAPHGGVRKEPDGIDPGIFLYRRRQVGDHLLQHLGVGGAGEVPGIVFAHPPAFVESEKLRPVLEALVPRVEELVVVIGPGPRGGIAQTPPEIEGHFGVGDALARSLEGARFIGGTGFVLPAGVADIGDIGVLHALGAGEKDLRSQILLSEVSRAEEGPAVVADGNDPGLRRVLAVEEKGVALPEDPEFVLPLRGLEPGLRRFGGVPHEKGQDGRNFPVEFHGGGETLRQVQFKLGGGRLFDGGGLLRGDDPAVLDFCEFRAREGENERKNGEQHFFHGHSFSFSLGMMMKSVPGRAFLSLSARASPRR